MDAQIARWEGKSFSGDDIYRLCDKKVRVMKYRDLKDFDNLSDAMGRYGALIILYETRENYGHWCAVFRVDRSTLEYFDPYGMLFDDELDHIPDNFKRLSGQLPYLSKLIAASRYKTVVYNMEPLQKLKKDTNTCGRWCGLRVCLRDVPLKQFIALFKKQKFPPDWYATALTLFV